MFSLTRFFTNFSIGKKLAIGFAILIALSVINGLTGIRSLGNYGSSAEAMAGASDIQSALQAARLEEKNFLLTGDVRHADQARQYLQQGISIIEELGASHTGEQLQSLDSIRAGAQRYSELLKQLVNTRQEKDRLQERLTVEGRVLEANINNQEDSLFVARAIFKQMQRYERSFLISGDEDSVRNFDERLQRALPSIEGTSLPDQGQEAGPVPLPKLCRHLPPGR